jgi:urease accessory protein
MMARFRTKRLDARAMTNSSDISLLLNRRVTIAPERSPQDATGTLSLTYEQRSRSRLRARLEDGREVGILLPRGETLIHGELLADERGELIRIRAAAEEVSCARTDDPLLLARAAYHLGNRHVALQIAPGRLCWLHDHVLDAMVRGLGLSVSVERMPFEPEAGAYGGAAMVQGHGHTQGQGVGAHDHGHDHGHQHGESGPGHEHALER